MAVNLFAAWASPDRAARWMLQTEPEVVLVFIAGRLLLWLAADALLLVGLCQLWWLHRAVPRAAASARPRLLSAAAGAAPLGLAVLLLTGGCSAAYDGERLYWKAQRVQDDIMKHPSQTTPAQFSRAVEAFERVTQQTPGTSWAARAHLAIGSLYAMQRRYDEARTAYGLVPQNYNRQQDLSLQARVAIAKTHEAQEQWAEAVAMYRDISEYHPWAQLGLEAPLYVAATYEKRGDAQEAQRAYQRAIGIYQHWIPQAPSEELAAQVRLYLALAYQRLGRWDEAIKVLRELASAKGINRPMILLALGSIYQMKLRDPEQAKAAYLQLLEEFPEHELSGAPGSPLERLGMPTPAPAAPTPPAGGP